MLWDSQHDDGIGWDGWGGLKMGLTGFSFSLLFAAFLLSFYGWGFGVCVCLRGRERRSICVSSSSSLGICVCVCDGKVTYLYTPVVLVGMYISLLWN